MNDRSNYKGTWEALVRTPMDARLAVVGYADGAQMDASGRHTGDVLDRFVGIRPSDVVLEIGCGVGRVERHITPRCAHWIGSDISRGMLAVAAGRVPRTAAGASSTIPTSPPIIELG